MVFVSFSMDDDQLLNISLLASHFHFAVIIRHHFGLMRRAP
jgi:hypothetical protein